MQQAQKAWRVAVAGGGYGCVKAMVKIDTKGSMGCPTGDVR